MTLITTSPHTREIRHFHLFCGLGGGAKGFNRGFARVGNMQASFRCIGGIDVDPAAIKDFDRLAGVPGTCLDLFSRQQYIAFHGHEPPAGWHEAGPADLHAAAGNERPHILFLSAPCKGFSGLLSESKSKTTKYQALNQLTVRGVWLALEAWKNDPPELIIFENVPRITARGRPLLDQITSLLRSYGYAVAETSHDCGELGGLAQSRKRFLLVARHMEKVPPFLYQPERQRLASVGSILGRMPLPGQTDLAGPMHALRKLHWKTWVRLAFVEAGSDWRSLNRLAVENGYLRDYLIMPESEWDNSLQLGVTDWNEPSGTIAAQSRPGNGKFSVADPRFEQSAKWNDGQAYGVRAWDEPTGTIAGQTTPGQGAYAVADPRPPENAYIKYQIARWDSATGTVISSDDNGAFGVADPRPDWNRRHNNMPVIDWDSPAKTIHQGGKGVQGGALSVADPRSISTRHNNVFRLSGWDQNAQAVTGGSGPSASAQAVADPRILNRVKGDNYLTGGHYGVLPWDGASGAVSSAANVDNGRWSVADPRLPDPNDALTCVIRSLDGTWHRPFTTLELAALQSLLDPEEHLELEGLSDRAWRERIGNAVPPKAAEAIAGVMGTTLLLAWSGETFLLCAQEIWVRPIATALAVKQP